MSGLLETTLVIDLHCCLDKVWDPLLEAVKLVGRLCFFEDAEISGSSRKRAVDLEEVRAELPVHAIQETTPTQ